MFHRCRIVIRCAFDRFAVFSSRRKSIAFFREAFENKQWKTAADEPLTKRVTIIDYPTKTYNFNSFNGPSPVATRDILDKLDSYPAFDAGAAPAGAVGGE